MSLIVYSGSAKYLAGDKRFTYLDETYFEDCANKVYLNEEKTIGYAIVGNLLNLEGLAQLDLHFKNWYYSARTADENKALIEQLVSLVVKSEQDTHCLILTKKQVFLLSNNDITEVDKEYSLAYGSGDIAANVCFIAKIHDPERIFTIVSLADKNVSATYDIIYQKTSKGTTR